MLMPLTEFERLCTELFPGAHSFVDETGKSPGRPTVVYAARVPIKGEERELRMSYPELDGENVNLYTQPHTEAIINEAPALETLRRFAEMVR